MTKLGTLKPSAGITLTFRWAETDGYHFTMDGVTVTKPKGTDRGDTLIIDSSAGLVLPEYPLGSYVFDATVAPALEGKKGIDAILFSPDDGYIDDTFFTTLRSFEVVQLADDDGLDDGGLNFNGDEGGSALFLGDYAFAAGIREVRGGTGSDILMAGDLTSGVGTASPYDAVSLTMLGGAGRDWLLSAGGNDFLDGGVGDDVVYGGGGADVIQLGAGADMLYYLLPTDFGPVQINTSDGITGSVTGTVDAMMGFQFLDDQIIVQGGSSTTSGDLLQLPLSYVPGEIQLSAASGAFEAFNLDLEGSDTLVVFDSAIPDPAGGYFPPLMVALDNTVFWEVYVADATLQYARLSLVPSTNVPPTDPIAGTSANDIAYIGVTLAQPVGDLAVYDATFQPSMNGGVGTDTIAMRGGLATIADDFFLNVTNFEGLRLADGVGSAVVLDVTAKAAGLTRAVGGGGDDQITFGAAYDAIGVQAAGHSGDDTLVGAGGNDTLFGGSATGLPGGDDGADTIDGKAGNDTIVGGTWRDDVTGGDGSDIFVLAEGDAGIPTAGYDSNGDGLSDGDTLTFGYGIDIIRDFTDGQDLLRLDETADELVACSLFDVDANDGNYGIGDDQFIALRGNYVEAVFTTDSAAGQDVLLAYDAEDHDGTIQVEFVVLVGVIDATIDTADFFGS